MHNRHTRLRLAVIKIWPWHALCFTSSMPQVSQAHTCQVGLRTVARIQEFLQHLQVHRHPTTNLKDTATLLAVNSTGENGVHLMLCLIKWAVFSPTQVLYCKNDGLEKIVQLCNSSSKRVNMVLPFSSNNRNDRKHSF